MSVVRHDGSAAPASYAEEMAALAMKAREEQYNLAVKEVEYDLKKVLNAIYAAAKKGQNSICWSLKDVVEEVDQDGQPLSFQLSLRDGILDERLHGKGFKTVVERYPSVGNLWRLVIKW